MSKHWLYIPLATHIDDELETMERRYGQKYGEKHVLHSNVNAPGTEAQFTYINRSRSGYFRPLKRISTNDILLIGAHGSLKSERVGVKSHTGVVGESVESRTSVVDENKIIVNRRPIVGKLLTKFTPDDLAAILAMDGLDRSHRLIKLNSCFACGAIGNDQFTCSHPFAKLLALALGLFEYRKIVVGGYAGAVVLNRGTPTAPKNLESSDGKISIPAHGTRRYYNADGIEVDERGAPIGGG